MTYKYSNPLDNGFKRVYIKRKDIKKIYKNRDLNFYDKYEFYKSKDQIVIHRTMNWMAILINVLSYPLLVLYYGFGEIKNVHEEYKDQFFQKQRGTFSSDVIFKRDHNYNEVCELIYKEDK